MISVSSDFKSALEANHRFWKMKVEIERNSDGAVPIDISDRVISVSISHDFSRRNASLEIEIENNDYSLSPLNRESATNLVGGVYDPLLDSRHIIRVYEGLLTDSGYEYVQRFNGVLGDDLDASAFPSVIRMNCRDYSKLFQDTYIYQSKTYSGVYTANNGDDNLTIVEYVMQDLINQFCPDYGINIEVLNPTQFVIGQPDKPYTAKNTSLWDALQLLADSSSHELRFNEQGRLILRKIERDFSENNPVIELDESSLIRDSVSLSDADVRNHIMVRVQGLDPVEKKNEDSIRKYGRRYMEVQRSISNVLTTQEQAHELAENFLVDLSWVNPIDEVEIPLYPILQVGDIVSIKNDSIGTNPMYDKFKVIRVQDSFNKSLKRTSLYLQGHTNYTPEESIAPTAPTDLSNEIITREIQNYIGSGWSGNSKRTHFAMLKWEPPTKDEDGNSLISDFGGYTIFRKKGNASQTNHDWLPIASVKSYIKALNLKVNYFYDYSVSSGEYTYKIRTMNRLGKVSAESDVMTVSVPNNSYT
ncbi:hypothetical protein [Chengkuizengella axinellae]|uniref:Prophage tail endopeptidase domain-containing protein n=1 Tax=Chengkuizengella axinellae TaxID=3064388 RepID=A0ABT9IXZ9_9BACL|nr:hypothetical protein [Chengkuizengella sp. 2205SS18-9]MDP5273675.1 hypothetical protein [Chengkuizengella sp. 2205SS18-9]